MEKRETVSLWFIRNTEDPTFHSIAFKSEQEAQQAIDETELYESHEPVNVEFPVRYDDKTMDRAARDWTQDNYENYSVGHWSLEDCWQFVDTEHHGGRGNFILMTLLDRPHTR
jgi:hypothetical protein